ncbi:TetR/AcrR family transcriptional regulator [bacterium]|nr:TetR/AcrR family transcriptional regulator [bacterium]
MGKRQDLALETRKKLIDTTKKLISEKGFSNLNVEEITAASGVAKGTFYTYFKHKEDILNEICTSSFKQIELKLKTIKNKDFIKKLEQYCSNFMFEVEKYGVNITREWIRDNLTPDNKRISKWQYDVDMLQDILFNAVKNSELSADLPVELLANIIISMLYGMMICWCMSDTKFEPEKEIPRFVKFQLKPMFKPYLKE